jgi:hypothetical protein
MCGWQGMHSIGHDVQGRNDDVRLGSVDLSDNGQSRRWNGLREWDGLQRRKLCRMRRWGGLHAVVGSLSHRHACLRQWKPDLH